MRTDVVVEVGWGGTVADPDTIVWDDISPRADLTSGISITRGAQDEFSETQTGTMTLRLDNSDGALTPGNSNSPFYPYVKRNTPIRAAVVYYPDRAGSAPWPLAQLADGFDDGRVDPVLWPDSYGGGTESGGRARIPCTPGVPAGLKTGRQWTLTGSQFVVRLTTLPATSGSSAASFTVAAQAVASSTRAGFSYSPVDNLIRCFSDAGAPDGTPTTASFNPTYHRWVRLRESGGTLYWETSPDGYSWAVLRSSSSPAWVGAGPVVMELATARTGGAADTVEVSYAGGVTYPRFYGAVNQWPIRWDGLQSTVTVTCSDLLKRLGRDRQLRSCLSEEILAHGPTVYYPLTEPAESVTAGDLSGGGASALSIVQTGVGGTLSFSGTQGPAATQEALPTLTPASTSNGMFLTADLGGAYQDASTSGWNSWEAWFQTSTVGRVIFALAGPAGTMRIVWSLDGTGRLQAESVQDGVTVVTSVATAAGNLADGRWHHMVYDEAGQTFHIDGALQALSTGVLLQVGLRTLNVGAYGNTRLWAGSIGHVGLYTTSPAPAPLGPTLATHYTAGMSAFAGEAADLRIQRLVSYSGLSAAIIYGTVHDPVASQGTGGQTALARMREVEATESAKLFPARDWLAMDYASRDMRYNPAPSSDVFVIDYADLETGDVELADDDQKLINTVIGSRPGGATQRVVDSASVAAFGTYAPPGGDMSILKMTDGAVISAAQWLVYRYADPLPELREVAVEAYSHPDYLSILGADIGSRFTVVNMPAQAPFPEERVTAEGYTETIGLRSHRIQFHTSRAVIDSVWVLDDFDYSQLGITTRLAY